ncbi:MAG: CoA transferase, partial [Actinomycetota bacterium]|nr:CoA transferase [Actinomycetota bacterium]
MLLDGIRVTACEIGLAGPLCTRLLADFGADVVKIERPDGGDVTRAWDTISGGLSSGFVWVNRGKRSVALDVKDPRARPALERLIARSDVFLQNFTPRWAERVGLDEPTVRALRPDIVHAEISGYGLDGPYADKNAYDLVMQGETGLISLTGTPHDPARVAVSLCDVGAGTYAAIATLAALVRRASTGAGEHVAVSLFDVTLDWLGYFPHLWWHREETPPRTGMRHPLFCPYGPYPAGDERLFSLAVLSPAHWRGLCEEVL